MSQKNELLDADSVFEMKYDDLRKTLKAKRLSAAGKKSILQFRLLEYIESQKDENAVEPIVEDDGEEEAQENMETDDNVEDQLNGTFTIEPEVDEKPVNERFIHEATPTNQVHLVLDADKTRQQCAEYGIDLSNYEVKSRPRAHRTSARKSLREQYDEDVATRQEVGSKRRSSRNILAPKENVEERDTKEKTPMRQKTPGRVTDRFVEAHAKEMAKMESLGDHRDRILKRHQEHTENVPNSIKRLATPKSVKQREPISKSVNRAWKPEHPRDLTFNFGGETVNEFKSVATAKTARLSSSVPRKNIPRARQDVKQLTKSAIPRSTRVGVTPKRGYIPATTPDDDTFVSFMATPKGKTPTRAPVRQNYTPHTNKLTFVDTTKLTDREYQLAVEEGLVPAKSGKKKTNLEMRQSETKKRRNDIIALKRKLNIK